MKFIKTFITVFVFTFISVIAIIIAGFIVEKYPLSFTFIIPVLLAAMIAFLDCVSDPGK